MQDRIRKASMRTGGPAIIHHPDDSRPSSAGFIPRLQLDLQAAGYLGSNFVVVHPPAEATPMASRLVSSDLVDQVTVNSVKRSGIGIALENLGPARHQPVMGDICEVASVVRTIRREYGERYGPELRTRVGMCLDYGHHIAFCAREGRDPVEALELLREDGDLVVMMHVHLNDGSADQHLLPGERIGGSEDDIITGYENLLLEEVIPGFTGCRTYVIERNSPFRMEELLFAARLIADSVPKNHREV
jgi:sugar phosphate isomerase/epimerase